MHWNWSPTWGPLRVGWVVWCGIWTGWWFIVGLLWFWPALMLMFMSVAAIVAAFVEQGDAPAKVTDWRTQQPPSPTGRPYDYGQHYAQQPPPPPSPSWPGQHAENPTMTFPQQPPKEPQ